MRTALWAALAAAGVSAVLAASAWAQALPLPSGSYRNSCADARASYQGRDKILTAQCQKANGGREMTSLRYDSCRGDIANTNGRLTCSTSGGPGGPGGPGGGAQYPAGSYRSSCSTLTMSGSVLSATCRDSRGANVRSSLDVRNCDNRDIANLNGRLTCAGGGGGQIPAGSYRQTCSGMSMTAQILTANCLDNRRQRVRSTLDVRTCSGRDIANANGRLTCSGGPGNGNAQLPQGSYRNSCSGAFMTGQILTANCRDSRGNTNRSTLDIRGCNRDIANTNGRLTCGAGNGGVVPPVGSGAITLYTQPGYGGRSATIDRAAPGLGQWEMANKAQSVQIRGNGAWLACTEQDYRGKCVTINGSQRDLRALGLDRRISSLRPVR